MNPKMKVPFALKRVAAATAIGLLSGPVWAGDIVADGKLESTNGSIYQLGYTIGFIDDKGNAIGNGKLYFGIDSFDNTQFLYFQMPLTYVDNTYGKQAAVDWAKGHSFDNLLGSDSLGNYDKKKGTRGFEWNGNSVDIDYIGEVETQTGVDKKGNPVYSVTDYRSGGMGTVETDGVTGKNDGKVNTDVGGSGGVGSILEIATSLEYNFDQYGLTYLTDSPAMTSNTVGSISYVSTVAPNWIYEVGYEIQFAANTFNADDWLDPIKAFTLISLGNPHVSPSKTDFVSYGQPVCIVGCVPQPVPEPGSLLLLGAGLGALGWARRRRRVAPEDTG